MNGLLDGYGSSSSSSENDNDDGEPRSAMTTYANKSAHHKQSDALVTDPRTECSATKNDKNGNRISNESLPTISDTGPSAHHRKRQRRWDWQQTAEASSSSSSASSASSMAMNLLLLQGHRPSTSSSTSMIEWDKDYLSMKILQNQHQDKMKSIPEIRSDDNKTILGNHYGSGEECGFAFRNIASIAAASTTNRSFAEQLLDEHEFNNPHLLAKAEEELLCSKSSSSSSSSPHSTAESQKNDIGSSVTISNTKSSITTLLMPWEQTSLQDWETGDNLWKLEEEARQRLYHQ